jgi:hypothetical protein
MPCSTWCGPAASGDRCIREGCEIEFPPYTTVQHYFYAWRDSDVLGRINFDPHSPDEAAILSAVTTIEG